MEIVNSLDKLKNSCIKYFQTLAEHPIPNVYSPDIWTYISNLKRPYEKPIGKYENISFFESVNRIASDLVLWYGLEILLKNMPNEFDKIQLCLGNEDDGIHGDFTISINKQVREGEVFNVAKSFFKQKLSYTKNKWKTKGTHLHYILCNKDGFPENYMPKDVMQWQAEDKWHEPEENQILLIKVDLKEAMKHLPFDESFKI